MIEQLHYGKLLNNIDKTIRDLENVRKQLINIVNDKQKNIPRCLRCGTANLRMRQKDKTYFCRSCGFDSANTKRT